jgi:hypothetical protein
MTILQLPTPLAGQEGLRPATKKMVSTDTLATIVTPGYLNAINMESYALTNTDVLEVIYQGGMGLFMPTIINGVTTLNAVTSIGGIQTDALDIFQSGAGIVTAKAAVTATQTSSGVAAATINEQSGVITTPEMFLSAGQTYTIDFTNTFLQPTSILLISLQGGSLTDSNISISAVVDIGGAVISLTYQGTITSLAGTAILGFIVL